MRLMRRSSRRLLGLALVAGTLLTALVAVWMLSQDGGGVRAVVQETPLDPAVREKVAQHVLKWTLEDYYMGGDRPRIEVVKDLTLEDLLSMGQCPSPDANPDDPRYVLAVVSGDLDLSDVPGMGRGNRTPEQDTYRYIARIVDVKSGTPTSNGLTGSPLGGSFRTILGDPSLPEDVPPGSPPGTKHVESPPLTLESCSKSEFNEFNNPPADPNKVQPTVAPEARP